MLTKSDILYLIKALDKLPEFEEEKPEPMSKLEKEFLKYEEDSLKEDK